MSDIAITATNISKRYLVGHQTAQPGSYTSLRDVIAREAQHLARKAGDFVRGREIIQGDEIEEFWALRDVSFEVKRGEVLGVVGRNGAGKSTLLKILSRITEPTRGRVVLRGRVASLLEVGTGFHGELTGRENIYLNGAILGMTKAEIKSKFDEIVAFAEVERFLDTPVKRYSSGMYVRLAFSVAAHLDPEILIVDEVLAVGDLDFQKKSLGKMRAVASKQNRTVLFVSHNLRAVETLCDRAILLDAGASIMEADSHSIVSRYLADASACNGERLWSRDSAPGTENLLLLAIRILSADGRVQDRLTSDDDFYVELEFMLRELNPNLCVGFDLNSSEGVTIFRAYQTDMKPECWPRLDTGINRLRCKVPRGLLNGGEFLLCPRIGIHNVSWIVNEDAVIRFRVELKHGVSPLWHLASETSRPGVVAPILEWKSFGN
jgi:lipopolysaccharide transport system ATP-binding protein